MLYDEEVCPWQADLPGTYNRFSSKVKEVLL
jgi:hypothetical protein